jgi:signal transduction histidine kinase
LKKIVYILVTFIFFLTGYFSIERLVAKPDLPFEFYADKSGVYFDDFPALPGKHKINSIDGFEMNNIFQMEFFLDGKQIGDRVKISSINAAGKTVIDDIILTSYYHNLTFTVISGFVGYVFLFMALFVVLKKPDSSQAVFLYWTLSLFGTAALTSPGQYNVSGDIIGYVIRTLHAVSYSAGGLFFVLFILSFPIEKLKERRVYIVSLAVLTFFITVFVSAAQVISIFNINSVTAFDISWDIVLTLLLISIAYGTFEFVKTIRALTNIEDKRKIEWILWGLSVGVGPYLLLWVIPYVFNLPIIVKEEYSLVFLVFVPIAFVIAVIKYQVMDIELVVKRSFVYTLLSASIIGIYIVLVYMSSILFSFLLGTELNFVNLLAVLITALSFNPLRNRLNRFADRVFYREKYAFDKAVREVLSRIRECLMPGELGRILISEIEKFIPVNAIAIISRKNGEERVKVLEQKNFDQLSKNVNALRVKQLESDFTLPLALENKIEKGIKVDTSMESVFKRWNINAVMPLLLENDRPCGAIVLGDKLSGLKYSSADFELLNAIASSAALALRRLELQEKLVQEEIEMSRLEELNELKSFYVASVSHDLKTPLTSIRVFTELMQSDKSIPIKKKNEYLRIIESETGRLTRLIDNVLDFAKIEKGIKQYSFTDTDLKCVIDEVLESIKYFIKMNKFSLEVEIKESVPRINGDSDAIKTALFNIITNSVKYSKEKKCIKIVSGTQDDCVFIEIADEGIGIAQSDQEMIFNPFFRSSSIEKNFAKGAGLGLSIVKHVMDAHGGRIELNSEVNFGTKIRLLFPLKNNECN